MRPPPRVWWDGADLWVLAPPPCIEGQGRSTLPVRSRTSADEVPAGAVELLPVRPAAGLEDDRVIASVVLEQRRRAPRWLRRLVCLAQGHNLIGVELPDGWSQQICRTCDEQVQAHAPRGAR